MTLVLGEDEGEKLRMSPRDVIIIGAGPAGLAAAIAAKKYGLDYTVLEKGMLVNSLYHFPTHMVFFTTPELLEIGGLPFVTPYENQPGWNHYVTIVVSPIPMNLRLTWERP